MLPIGTLAPHPGFGPARPSRLTMDEQRTLLTLQAIARSPLILGANLTRLDDATRALITNKDVIAVNQSSRENHPVTRLPKGFDHVRVWVASGRSDGERYLAIFNLDDKPVSLHAPWGELGLASGSYDARDLWSGQPRKASARLSLDLPAHGCVLLSMRLAR
jgi:alpha-galactosidase